ncbi:aminotransferase-like domain-containing protein [Desmospora profundinema]|uniref:DNA-binding transcriptional MocR family regulator n=1 Tax=Desmospora profundinema TaxID=1571184 RepID=A0ABU1IHA6_9BACL|nr:PLP-dependent aminotransferase family protein [Desmospora profundinema]MDR6224161.1 DNA-binding transcriptional MocR family regulator [Desmospora profundinema]
MEWKPDRNSKIPIYQQIIDWIEQKITCGEWPPGSLLPSERRLSRILNVNRSTIVTVYQELAARGWVETKRRAGTYVSRDMWGAAPNHFPNWHQYAKEGTFLPNLPLLRRVRKEINDGECIDFAGDQSNSLFPRRQLQTNMRQNLFDAPLQYDHSHGYSPLRETIAAHAKTFHDIQAPSSSILVTSGAQQALFLITHSLLQPGDAIAMEQPSYFYSLPLFQSAGLRLFPLPLGKEGLDPEEIERLYRKHRIRMVFLNPTFQNPTGYTLPLEIRKKVVEKCAKLGIPIVEDDPFSLLSIHGSPPHALKAMDPGGLVLYIGSLSKTVASGLRMGWLIGPQEILDRLADVRQQMDYGLSIFPQWIAHQFLSSQEFMEHVSTLKNRLMDRQQFFVSIIQKHLQEKVEFILPQGGIHLWCKLKTPIRDGKLLDAAIQQSVLFVPGSVYGSPDGFVRFTYARAPKDQMEEGVQRFKKALSIFGV